MPLFTAARGFQLLAKLLVSNQQLGHQSLQPGVLAFQVGV
jgi:hypothetical protein